MAFPQVEATNNSVDASDTRSHTVNLPAGIQAGETLLVFFATDTNSATSFPEGWTKIYGSFHLNVGWRKADGEEGASITITTGVANQSVHISYRISGATDPTSTSPERSTGATGTSANPNPSSLAPTGGSKEYLWIAVEGNNDDDIVTDYPTNYTNGETYISAEGSNTCAIGIARRELETDSEDPSTFTIEGVEAWYALTVAVYPTVPPVVPDPPTNVAATDGGYTDKVVITWTKSTGATGYRVYRNGGNVGGLLGDVATYDDSGASAGVITPGTASASDGTSTAHVVLSLAGESVANGTTYTYKVVAVNATGNSDDSSTNTGYRGTGALTYQWQRSTQDGKP